jgi:hypothetical protein
LTTFVDLCRFEELLHCRGEPDFRFSGEISPAIDSSGSAHFESGIVWHPENAPHVRLATNCCGAKSHSKIQALWERAEKCFPTAPSEIESADASGGNFDENGSVS